MMTAAPITSDPAVEARTDAQVRQFKSIVEGIVSRGGTLVLEKVPLDKSGMQRLLENGDDFKDAVIDLMIEKARQLSLTNQFVDEEVDSEYGYLSGYRQPSGITQQTNRLRELFPGIGFANEKLVELPLPQGAEGYFAIPRWQSLASTYGEAVQRVLDMIKQTRDGKFYNYIEGQLGPKQLRQHAKTARAFERIGQQQEGYDLLVVPAQFGLTHRGRSVRRAREVMNAFEFGLGAFANGIMILTHPNRLQHYDDLWIDCAGDERSPDADDSFDDAPCFSFNDGWVGFDGGYVDDAFGLFGSASGFLPQ